MLTKLSKIVHLSDLERFILLSIMANHNLAKAKEITENIHKKINKTVSVGALYSTLARLKHKGYVMYVDRGYFSVTNEGIVAIKMSLDDLIKMCGNVSFVDSSGLKSFTQE